jgi:hypothetical protein
MDVLSRVVFRDRSNYCKLMAHKFNSIWLTLIKLELGLLYSKANPTIMFLINMQMY